MSDLDRFLQEELKDPGFRFWWYFYGPYYMYHTARIKIQAIMRRRKCCKKRRKVHECKRNVARMQY